MTVAQLCLQFYWTPNQLSLNCILEYATDLVIIFPWWSSWYIFLGVLGWSLVRKCLRKRDAYYFHLYRCPSSMYSPSLQLVSPHGIYFVNHCAHHLARSDPPNQSRIPTPTSLPCHLHHLMRQADFISVLYFYLPSAICISISSAKSAWLSSSNSTVSPRPVLSYPSKPSPGSRATSWSRSLPQSWTGSSETLIRI